MRVRQKTVGCIPADCAYANLVRHPRSGSAEGAAAMARSRPPTHARGYEAAGPSRHRGGGDQVSPGCYRNVSLIQLWVLRVSRRLLSFWRRQSRPPSLTLAASQAGARAGITRGLPDPPPQRFRMAPDLASHRLDGLVVAAELTLVLQQQPDRPLLHFRRNFAGLAMLQSSQDSESPANSRRFSNALWGLWLCTAWSSACLIKITNPS